MLNMEKRMLPVEGHYGYYRDSSTGAIIVSDDQSYNEYLKKKQQALQKLEKEKAKDEELNNIKNEVKELKDLVKELIQEVRNASNK